MMNLSTWGIRLFASLVISVIFLGEPALGQEGKTHRLEATPQTVHTGFFDASIPPVLTIESGDTVVLSTMMLMDGQLRCGMTLEELLKVREEYSRRMDHPQP